MNLEVILLKNKIFDEYKLVIFDADGTVRDCIISGQDYPINEDQWILEQNIHKEIKKYNWKDKHFGVATNQPGVSLGQLTEETCISLIENMVQQAFGFLPHPEALQCCYHHIDGQCSCRKPEPGMLLKVMSHYNICPSQTVFVGDSKKDEIAATNAGCHFIWVHDIIKMNKSRSYSSKFMLKLVKR